MSALSADQVEEVPLRPAPGAPKPGPVFGTGFGHRIESPLCFVRGLLDYALK